MPQPPWLASYDLHPVRPVCTTAASSLWGCEVSDERSCFDPDRAHGQELVMTAPIGSMWTALRWTGAPNRLCEKANGFLKPFRCRIRDRSGRMSR